MWMQMHLLFQLLYAVERWPSMFYAAEQASVTQICNKLLPAALQAPSETGHQ